MLFLRYRFIKVASDALPFEQSRLDSYTFEGSGYRLDCNAPDHFPRLFCIELLCSKYVLFTGGSEHYAFAWTFGGADRYVKQSTRVFVSGDGSLYFAHVLAEDNGNYACSLIDERLATGVIGPTFSLHVQESPHGVLNACIVLFQYFQALSTISRQQSTVTFQKFTHLRRSYNTQASRSNALRMHGLFNTTRQLKLFFALQSSGNVHMAAYRA